MCPFTFCSFWLPNWYLQTLILTIFQLYRCGQFDRWSKQKYQEKNIESTRNTDLLQAIDNHRPTPSHYWQTLAYNDIKDTSPWMGIELTTLSVIGTDCIGRYVHVPYDHRHKSPRYVKICCVCLLLRVFNAKYEKRFFFVRNCFYVWVWVSVRVMVFNATFNNISAISWWLVLLVADTGVPGENHQTVASHWQTVSHNVVSSTPLLSRIQTHNVSDDRYWMHR